MSRFFESIKLKDGVLYNTAYHLDRMNNTVFAFHHLKQYYKHLTLFIPPTYRRGLFKVRIQYNLDIEKIEFLPYEVKRIQKLYLVHDDAARYPFKETDRSFLDKHEVLITPTTDIIIAQQGILKEGSFANICLFDGLKWYTPSTPLHHGTKRSFLLKTNQIIAHEIMVESIQQYQKACFINALLDLGELIVSTDNIEF